jgi:hypothetical protein
MLFKGSNNLVQIYRSFVITGNYGRRSFSKYGISYSTFFLLHCDEWDRVVALPRHKFVTGDTLLQLSTPHVRYIWSCVYFVSAELQRGPIRHNGAKKKLQLKHKTSLFTLQTFH